jgi:hypothetical protein
VHAAINCPLLLLTHDVQSLPDSEAIVKAERYVDSDTDIAELQQRTIRALHWEVLGKGQRRRTALLVAMWMHRSKAEQTGDKV